MNLEYEILLKFLKLIFSEILINFQEIYRMWNWGLKRNKVRYFSYFEPILFFLLVTLEQKMVWNILFYFYTGLVSQDWAEPIPPM